MNVRVKNKGSFKNILNFFRRSKDMRIDDILDRYGRMGVDILSSVVVEDNVTSSSVPCNPMLRHNHPLFNSPFHIGRNTDCCSITFI